MPTGTTEAELAGVFYTVQGVDMKQRDSLLRRLVVREKKHLGRSTKWLAD